MLLTVGCSATYEPVPLDANVCIAPEFTADERAAIESAMGEWHERTDGEVRYQLGCRRGAISVTREPGLVDSKGRQVTGLASQMERTIRLAPPNEGDALAGWGMARFRSLALHEFGHMLGLQHSDVTGDVMHTLWLSQEHLSPGDLAAFEAARH